MKNGISRRPHVSESITARVLVGVATIAAAVVLFRALPDLIRYMRVRRM
jgi:hypothetical protein